jgi:hypothetical protein
MATRRVIFCDRCGEACGEKREDVTHVEVFAQRKSDGVEMANYYYKADLCDPCTRIAFMDALKRLGAADLPSAQECIKALKARLD